MKQVFTIQEVVARTGLSIHAFRYYERAGLLPPVQRAASGHRRYTVDDLNCLAFLLHLSSKQVKTELWPKHESCGRAIFLGEFHPKNKGEDE